jgi:O-antigen/teichoic acid export membrane protein
VTKSNTIQIRDRLLRGIGASALGQLINTIGRLVLIPLFLSSWGTVSYGEWLILSSLAAFLSFGDLGAQSYFVNRLTNEWATGSRAAFQETLSTGLAFFISLSISILLASAVVFIYLPVEIWFGIKSVTQTQAYWVLVLSVAQLAVSIPLGFLLGIYRALGKQATGVMFSNLIMIMQLLVTAIVLQAGAGLAEMAAYLLVSVLTCALIVIWNVHYRFQGTPIFSLRAIRLTVLKEGVHPSAHFFAAQLSQLMTVQGAVVVIGKMLGPVEVVLFTTTRTLMNSVRQISGILHNMSWPEFTRLHAVKSSRLFVKLYLVVFSSSILIVVILCALVIYFGEEISVFWLNGKVHLDRTVVSMMGTSTILSNVWMANLVLLMSINEHAALARIQVISGVIGLILLAVGAYNWGLAGAIGGLIVGEGLPMVIASYFQIVQLSWLKVQKRNITVLMVAVTCAAFFLLVSTTLTIAGIVALLLCIYSVLVTSHTLEPNKN